MTDLFFVKNAKGQFYSARHGLFLKDASSATEFVRILADLTAMELIVGPEFRPLTVVNAVDMLRLEEASLENRLNKIRKRLVLLENAQSSSPDEREKGDS